MTPSDLVSLLYHAHWTDFGVSGSVSVTIDHTLLTRRATMNMPVRPLRPLVPESPTGTRTKHLSLHEGGDPLLRPAWLASAYRLQMGGQVQSGGRDGWAVTATPRPGADERTPLDRVDAVVDALTGVLLRYVEIWDGQPLQIRELTEARITNPEGKTRKDDPRESIPDFVEGLGGLVTVADVAAEGLSVLLRHSGKDWSGARSPMPQAPSPAVGTAISPAQVFTLSDSGERNFAASVHQWMDSAMLSGPMRTAADKAEMGGLGSLAQAMDSKLGTRYTVTGLQYGGPLRYRVDYREGAGPNSPDAIACDGTQLSRFFPGKVVVWPGQQILPQQLLDLADTAWLLDLRLADVSETEFNGREAFRAHARQGHLGSMSRHAPSLVRGDDIDVIIDRELGIALRVIAFRDSTPVLWTELRDVGSLADLDTEIPAGVRVVHERGDFLDKTQLADPVKATLRVTADAVQMTAKGVAAARRLFGRP
jgi:hypothetical protein